MTAIPYPTAAELCEQICLENKPKWYTFDGMWCLGCATFSGEVEKRCFNNAPGCNGCSQVNQRYQETQPPAPH
jgi:hypothetical protein